MLCDCGEPLIEMTVMASGLPDASNAIGGVAVTARLLSNCPSRTLRLFGSLRSMVGKRVQFDEETWQAIQAVTRQTGKSFQELARTAFAEMLKKHNQPIGFKAALEASVTSRSKVKRAKAAKRSPTRRR